MVTNSFGSTRSRTFSSTVLPGYRFQTLRTSIIRYAPYHGKQRRLSCLSP